MRNRFLFAALAFATLAGPAMAANATRPYQNIDRRNDQGNDTGDSRVDALNRAQLDENYYNRNPNPGPVMGAPPPMMPKPAYTR